MSLLEVNSISKHFTGTRALDRVSFTLDAGEIIGLIGENGAGKSTLIKILSGVHQPDAGTILWQDSPITFPNPQAAMSRGVATIHQELAYFEKLTVAENLLMSEPWPRRRWGGIDWKRLNQTAATRLASTGLTIDPQSMLQALSPAQRQEIAIARALSAKARLVILDEPTASLTEPEVERLIDHLERLKNGGVAILYVTHRLDEILRLTQRVIVLRDGMLAAEYPTNQASIERLVRDMVGRELQIVQRRAPESPGPVIFSARGLSRPPLFHEISFDVRAGEVVGLAGLIGAGRSELARAIFGLYPPQSGTMEIAGKPYAPRSPSDARDHRIACVPEERKRHGFVLDHSVQSSISVGLLHRLSRFGWIFGRREAAKVTETIAKFQIKARSARQPIRTLSGGNQQKALLARWLETDPQFIILDEPTRGVDVGAKAEIHRLISELATQRKAILVISSDLPELLALSDRILVLHHGKLSAEFPAATATQEQILLAASGFGPGKHD